MISRRLPNHVSVISQDILAALSYCLTWDVFVILVKVEVVIVKDMANIIGCSTLTWTALLRNPAGSN